MAASILYKFGDSEPMTLDKMNSNFASVIGALNSLAGSQLLQLGPAAGGDGTVVPVSGGAFLGQVSFPSVMIGPTGGTMYLAVTMGDIATPTDLGVAKQCAVSADTAGAVASEILTELRDLKTKMRTAGLLDV